MNKKLPAYISFLLFISLIALFILEIAGQSNLLSVSATEYLDFLRHGQILIVSAVIIFVSLGVARIATSGLFRKVASVKEIFAKRIFWLSFSIFLFVQIIGIYMLRAINIEQP